MFQTDDLNRRESTRTMLTYNKYIKHKGYSFVIQTDDLNRRERHTNDIDL